MNEQIRIAKIIPGNVTNPKILEIPNTLEALQEQVGGYIETFYLFNGGKLASFANEDGKFNGMEMNFALAHPGEEPVDVIHGPIIITKYDDEGETISLSNEDIHRINDKFHRNHPLVYGDDSTRKTRIPLCVIYCDKI